MGRKDEIPVPALGVCCPGRFSWFFSRKTMKTTIYRPGQSFDAAAGQKIARRVFLEVYVRGAASSRLLPGVFPQVQGQGAAHQGVDEGGLPHTPEYLLGHDETYFQEFVLVQLLGPGMAEFLR